MLVERLTQELGLSAQFVTNLARGASFEYKKYTVQKKHGGEREIMHPSRRLKGVQSWLLRNILQTWPVHPAAKAYREGIGIKDNAQEHVASRYLLRLDLENFFPSITAHDLVTYLASRGTLTTGWTPTDHQIFSSFLFKEGQLAIGAPTSPALSNALCFELDSQLSAYAQTRSLTYTRYADDLFFSCMLPGRLQTVEADVAGILTALTTPNALQINALKTRHSSKRKRREVTGLVLGSDGRIHVPRKYKRAIRALLHQYEALDPVKRVSLAGMISYVVGIEPNFYNALVFKYGAPLLAQAIQLPSLIERQHIHLPKVKPSPKKAARKSSLEVVRSMLRAAGFSID